MLFRIAEPDLEDDAVLDEIHGLRVELAGVLRTPSRWDGGLRRSMLARAIQASNSIEGYDVELDDAAAALDDEEALSADARTFAEIRGYRQALRYLMAMAGDSEFKLDASAIRGMHYMMLSHDLANSPGQLPAGCRLCPRRDHRGKRLRRPGRGRSAGLDDIADGRAVHGLVGGSTGAGRDGPPEPGPDPSLPRRERPDGQGSADAGAVPRRYRRTGLLEYRGVAGRQHGGLLPRAGRDGWGSGCEPGWPSHRLSNGWVDG
jgi:hypothetical protein